jgi:hypothetical protein
VADPDHSGPDLGDGHLWCVGLEAGKRGEAEQHSEKETADGHGGSASIIREKSLLVKEKWANDAPFLLTRNDRV